MQVKVICCYPRENFQADLASISTDEQQMSRIAVLRDCLTRHGQHSEHDTQRHDDISLGQARCIGDETGRRDGMASLGPGKPRRTWATG